MTAEVVIMNKEAVALAADSAVTIISDPIVPKIFNSATKLYSLAPEHAVGVLIFNNAQFMGLPWETILERYSRRIIEETLVFPMLEDYTQDFLQFIEGSVDFLFPEEEQVGDFRSILTWSLGQIIRDIQLRRQAIILQQQQPISNAQLIQIAITLIDQIHFNLSAIPSLFDEKKQEDFLDNLLPKYGQVIDDCIAQVFAGANLPSEALQKIKDICVLLSHKDHNRRVSSGIVFAGFGRDDLLPGCLPLELDSIIAGKLKYKRLNGLKLDRHDMTGAVLPFAQDDMVVSFLEGMHPDHNEWLEQEVKPRLLTQGLSEENWNNFWDDFMTQQMLHAHSIVNIVKYLPKEELALMAEALVTLTSFKRHISMTPETVGGPVDVAIISKHDGFMWVKRKSIEKYNNPHIFRQPIG